MIELPLEKIRQYCQTQPIQTLSLFGSALRGQMTDQSDIDLLVRFIPNTPVTLFDMVDMEITLTQITGQKVDLRTPNELSRYFREDVIREAVLVYERVK